MIIVYVKDKGSNLNTMIDVLTTFQSCDILGLEENYEDTCFGHAFLEACQYAIMDEKVIKI